MGAVGIGILGPFSGWAAAGKIGIPAIPETPTPERLLHGGSGRGPA
jgi:hypothetical protein